MIQEHFCNYENSLALKKLGFEEDTIFGFNSFNLVVVKKLVDIESVHSYTSWSKYNNQLRFPLLSQAIQWIQGVKELAIEIKWDDDLSGWSYYLYDTTKKNVQLARNCAYETWNQCAQDAITVVIKLIKE